MSEIIEFPQSARITDRRAGDIAVTFRLAGAPRPDWTIGKIYCFAIGDDGAPDKRRIITARYESAEWHGADGTTDYEFVRDEAVRLKEKALASI